jgi:hypothetical protein
MVPTLSLSISDFTLADAGKPGRTDPGMPKGLQSHRQLSRSHGFSLMLGLSRTIDANHDCKRRSRVSAAWPRLAVGFRRGVDR